MADYLKLAESESLSKYQIWYRNPKNRAKVLAHQAALKAADPVSYRKKKRDQYFRKRPQYRAYYKKWYEQKKEEICADMRAKNRTIEGIFRTGKKNAKDRGIEWLLTIEQLNELRQQSCFYCGGSLPEAGHGLDRKDHKLPYEKSNVLPCCFNCNRHRGDDWTVEEAKIAISAVMKLRNGHGD